MNPFDKYLGPEDKIHRAIMEFIRYQYPQAVVAHPPNGVGNRYSKLAAYKTKILGVSRGIPDILVFSPGLKYAGLAIEVKAGKNKMTPEQVKWQNDLKACGWATGCVYSLDEAMALLRAHFGH